MSAVIHVDLCCSILKTLDFWVGECNAGVRETLVVIIGAWGFPRTREGHRVYDTPIYIYVAGNYIYASGSRCSCSCHCYGQKDRGQKTMNKFP